MKLDPLPFVRGSEDGINCPWCKTYYPRDDWEDSQADIEQYEGYTELDCKHCNKPFEINVEIEMSFYVSARGSRTEHDKEYMKQKKLKDG